MYRLKEIQESLLHLVGWEQNYNPDEYINPELTETESGLYFQGQHPLMTLKNIKSVMPDDFVFIYPEWNMIAEYHKGDKVRHNERVWLALRDNQNEEPLNDFNNDFNDDFGWENFNPISDYVERETRSGIATMVQNFITKKLLSHETRTIIENRAIMDGAGRLAATITNQGKICGFEITPVRSMGVTTKIDRIGLQTTGASGIVRVYIFHSNNVNAVKTIDFNVSGQNGFQWFETPDLYLPYIGGENQNAGGSWYIVYNQNDLPTGMEAIDLTKDFSREPCGSCNKGNLIFWRELMKYVEIHPFKYTAPLDFKEYPELWDIEKNIYTNTINYGLNLEITVGCDLTDFIIRQRAIFANVLSKQVTANMLRKMAMNPDMKVNRNQLNVSRQDVLYELDGSAVADRRSGLGNDLENAYKGLSINTRGLDRICLGCNNGGIRFLAT